jgi:hypothetical protein
MEHARIALLETNNRFEFNRNSFLSFPNSPGVYAVYLFEELIYIGESADLKDRMKDMKNTYNHTLRKKLGFHFFHDAEILGRKFSNEIENRLNLIFQHGITISFVEVNFGRTEIENYVIKMNQNLHNSISLRGN